MVERDEMPEATPEHESLESIVTSFGFEFEEHQVVTTDGYILIVHRIHLKLSS